MAGAERRVRVLALLADCGPRIERLCDSCVTHLSDITGAGLAVMTVLTARGSRYHTDKISAQVDDLQFALGEGPCMDAFNDGRPVLIEDLTDREHALRWPAFTPAAIAAGARGLFALPLRIGSVRIGVLDLYRDRPGALLSEQLDDALVYADAATLLLLTEDQPDGADWQTQADHDDRAVMHQATGMIMAQTGAAAAEALAVLRARAYSLGRPLGEVAQDVIFRRIHLDDLDGER